MERLAAILAGPASGHALDYRLVRYLDRQRAVDIDTCLLKRFGLRDGSGHTVEDIAVFAVGLGKALVNDADNDIVGNELAAFHIRLSLQTYGRAVFHGSTEDIAGRNGGDREHAAQYLSLSTFTCAGSA